jgi:hypothetical protein
MVAFCAFLFLFIVTLILFKLGRLQRHQQKLEEAWGRITATECWKKIAAFVSVVFGVAALGLFLAGLTVNVSSWFFLGVARYAKWVGFAFGALFLLSFIGAIVRSSSQKPETQEMPKWVNRISSVLSIYFFVQFGICMFRPEAGWAARNSHESSTGQVHLEQTAEDKLAQEDLPVTRFFSGFVMMGGFAIATHLLLAKDRKGPFGKYNAVVKQI